ncbi:MAG: ATP-dependent DNA helicase RecG, partial [Burkholderiales bacterium]|nr:ATP-dependent DNA helicase RecG [Burkholderiales bacterium]
MAKAKAGSFERLPASVRKHLEKLGLRSAFDLVLHLPLRYEDETRLTALRDARAGDTVQVETTVESSEVAYRPRRMLVCRTRAGDEPLVLRFFNFYPSQLKQLSAGVRVRAMGEVRRGFFGAEMIHPRYRVVRTDTPLPQSLTPVYPATAGLQQHVLRKAIAEALAEVDLSDPLPADLLQAVRLSDFAGSVRLLHQPPPEISAAALEQRTHPAWRRIKFDELLAQQLSMRLHHRRRQSTRASALAPPAGLSRKLLADLPFRLTGAQQRCLEQIRHDLAQP